MDLTAEMENYNKVKDIVLNKLDDVDCLLRRTTGNYDE